MLVYGIFRNELLGFHGRDILLEDYIYSQEDYAIQVFNTLNGRNTNELIHFFIKEIKVK